MRALYTLLLYLALPFVLLRLALRARRQPEYLRRVGERFGYVRRPVGDIAVWIHAVSVGETLAAAPFIEALVRRYGEGRVWVSSTTPTGSERLRRAFGHRVAHSYAPYDLPDAVARFLRRVRPRRVVVMETEIWPNLYAALWQRRIPLLIANARMSRRSFARWMRWRGIAGQVLAQVRLVAAQSKRDARRFHHLGAPRVRLMGNLKYDITPDAGLIERGRQLRRRLGESRPVWVAASTHAGEEEQVLAAHDAVLAAHPAACLILVPRHPQRFAEVAQLIDRSGLRWKRRSVLDLGGCDRLAEAPEVLLGDSMGEMFLYLAAADLAFVGGSLVEVGGHNVLEPASIGRPVLFGSHMGNFSAARSLLLRGGAAREVRDGAELAGEVASLLGDAETRQAMAHAGERCVAGNRGALQRLLHALDEIGEIGDGLHPATHPA